MSILTIIGTRPQFIKSVLLSKELERLRIKEVSVHTGQHYDKNMSDVFFDEFSLPKPRYTLSQGGKTHSKMTAGMMIDIEKIVKTEMAGDGVKAIMVYGDCNTTLAGALVGAKMLIPVIHVESGLRSFDKTMPEEINRTVVDRVSDLLLCPSDVAMKNLQDENCNRPYMKCGDLMIDLLRENMSKVKTSTLLRDLGIEDKYLVATIHRQNNTTKDRLKAIMNWFSCLNYKVVIPLHPRTKKVMEEEKLEYPENLHVIDPVGYIDMMTLVDRSIAVLTDSGGLQKEAYELKKPCFTLRENTEWTELLETGWNILLNDRLPDNIDVMIDQITLLDHPQLYPPNSEKMMAEKIKDFISCTS